MERDYNIQAGKCSIQDALAIRDTLDLLNGKWKLPIMGALLGGKKRFKELERAVTGITPKMLSKELRDLELNQMVSRTVHDTLPPTVEYEITEYGRSLDIVIIAMRDWGFLHRKRIFGEMTATHSAEVPASA
ncbi:DNA-binding transcriptional regulator, HxlR family [Flexibacter flexilis DSM 6793]|uniref:DNA-binding transcriptional regulator, HxlR family n=1 Tax=Flexibacter flexilis DSM 6793 TaxID=927664 RepID=A0A1I1JZL3_9BACT|nr:helix-turn-helix domain-containing protein [Flexibacter flexilis]SFC53815.1 DNA-binding transcriptional regulator, HxlR family [Flexibacter flexilis DSM 6793]